MRSRLRTCNDVVKAFDELFSAVDCGDTSNLWGRKAGLAKSINDNRDISFGSPYRNSHGLFHSCGSVYPYSTRTHSTGLIEFSNFFFWALLAVLGFGIYTGSFSQNRLRRLVKEHKDYTIEFENSQTCWKKKGLTHSIRISNQLLGRALLPSNIRFQSARV